MTKTPVAFLLRMAKISKSLVSCSGRFCTLVGLVGQAVAGCMWWMLCSAALWAEESSTCLKGSGKAAGESHWGEE